MGKEYEVMETLCKALGKEYEVSISDKELQPMIKVKGFVTYRKKGIMFIILYNYFKGQISLLGSKGHKHIKNSKDINTIVKQVNKYVSIRKNEIKNEINYVLYGYGT